MISAVRTAQFGCSRRSNSATYKESKAARPSLIPYRILRSPNAPSSGQCHLWATGRAVGLPAIVDTSQFRLEQNALVAKEKFPVFGKGAGRARLRPSRGVACLRKMTGTAQLAPKSDCRTRKDVLKRVCPVA